MLRGGCDHANWVLIVILAILALLLAMVSTSGYGLPERVPEGDARSLSRDVSPANPSFEVKEVTAPSEVWFVAREWFRQGRAAEAYEAFDQVRAAYPNDAGARMWAGLAAYRCGDHVGAIRHWQEAEQEAELAPGENLEGRIWRSIALAAANLELGRISQAAQAIVPLEAGEWGLEPTDHPVVCFYAALVYERMASAGKPYRDAVEESLAERFSPGLALSHPGMVVSPNSRSWLMFLTKRALERATRGAGSLNWAAPVVPASATSEPSLVPTVEELLEAIGSADFAAQARQKLRALKQYESESESTPEQHDDDSELPWRARCIA